MTELQAESFSVAIDGGERRERSDKVAEKVARRILRDIVARGLEPGTKLPPEAWMLERYEIARASLREGLRILEVYGLIWIKPGPGGGPVVADVNSIDFGRSATFFYHAVGATLHELVEARVHIEPIMARLATERLTDETKETLRFALAYEEATLDDAEAIGGTRADRFHNVVAGLSGNRVLGLFGQSVIDIYVERVRPIFSERRRGQLHDVHQDIGTAILRGNATKAETLMREHVQQIQAQFAKRFPESSGEIIDWR